MAKVFDHFTSITMIITEKQILLGDKSMKITDKNKQAIMWGMMMLAVLGVTIGIFLTFIPEASRYSYWTGMIDLCLMELFSGIYFIYNLYLSTKRQVSKTPVAMHIGIQSTISIFMFVSVAAIVAFLVYFNRYEYDAIFLWGIISKWVLLFLIITPMWFAGQEGEEEKKVQTKSRQERVDILSTVQQTLVALHKLQINNSETKLHHQVIDEVDALRNQIRGWLSSGQIVDNRYDLLFQLVNEFNNSMDESNISQAEECKQTLIRFQKVARKISQEISKLQTLRINQDN